MDNVAVNPSGSTLIATDDVNGVQHQKVKVTLGDDGMDGGSVSNSNPMPAEIVGIFKRLFQVFGRLSFDGSSQLRTAVSGTVGISSNQTIGTVSTANIGLGDIGKASTAQIMSANTFYSTIGRNFTRG